MFFARAVLCAESAEGAAVAFAMLAVEDLSAAQGLALILARFMPSTAPQWQAILDKDNLAQDLRSLFITRYPKWE